MKSKLSILLLMLLLVVLFQVPAWAAQDVVWVDDDWADTVTDVVYNGEDTLTYGTEAFASIQEAVNAVDIDGTVYVAAGIYEENVFINKSDLEILGANGEIPAGIDAGTRGAESEITGGIEINADNVVVKGLKVAGGGILSGNQKAGIYLVGGTSGHNIANNIVQGSGSAAASGPGILFGYGVSDVEVRSNDIDSWYQGVYINPSSNLDFSDNNINHNYVGIGSDGLEDVVIQGNIFADNDFEAWGSSDVGENVRALENIFTGNPAAINHYSGGPIDASNNYWGEDGPNGYVGGAVDVFPFYLDEGMTQSSNDGLTNIIVDNSWSGFEINTKVMVETNEGLKDYYIGLNAFADIQGAIDAAEQDAVISIYPGTYETGISAFDRDPRTGGAGANDFILFVGTDGITLQGVDAGGIPITDYSDVEANIIATGVAPTFGASVIFVQADGVTIQGLEFTPHQPNKTIEIAGDAFTLRASKVHGEGAGAVYFSDFNFDADNKISSVNTFTVEDNYFDNGSVSVNGGFGYPAGDMLIKGNYFNGRGITAAGKIENCGWMLYPVGAPDIEDNIFEDASVVQAGVGGIDFDWDAILANNEFNKKVIVYDSAEEELSTLRTFWYKSGDVDVYYPYKGIGFDINTAVSRANLGDVVKVSPDRYEGNLVIGNSVVLKGNQAGIDARGRQNAAETVIAGLIEITAEAENVTIDGFVIDHPAQPNNQPAVSSNAAGEVRFINNIVDANFSEEELSGGIYQAAVVINGAETVTAAGNAIEAVSDTERQPSSLFIGSSGDVLVEDNEVLNAALGFSNIYGELIVEDNLVSGSAGDGMFLYNAEPTNVRIENNRFLNATKAGIRLLDVTPREIYWYYGTLAELLQATLLTVQGNEIENTGRQGTGIVIQDTLGTKIDNNTIQDHETGLEINHSEVFKVTGNTIADNATGILVKDLTGLFNDEILETLIPNGRIIGGTAEGANIFANDEFNIELSKVPNNAKVIATHNIWDTADPGSKIWDYADDATLGEVDYRFAEQGEPGTVLSISGISPNPLEVAEGYSGAAFTVSGENFIDTDEVYGWIEKLGQDGSPNIYYEIHPEDAVFNAETGAWRVSIPEGIPAGIYDVEINIEGDNGSDYERFNGALLVEENLVAELLQVTGVRLLAGGLSNLPLELPEASYKVEFTVENLQSYELDPLMIVQVKNADGVPVNLGSIKTTLAGRKSVTSSIEFSLPEDEETASYTVEIFLWSEWPNSPGWEALAPKAQFDFPGR